MIQLDLENKCTLYKSHTVRLTRRRICFAYTFCLYILFCVLCDVTIKMRSVQNTKIDVISRDKENFLTLYDMVHEFFLYKQQEKKEM